MGGWVTLIDPIEGSVGWFLYQNMIRGRRMGGVLYKNKIKHGWVVGWGTLVNLTHAGIGGLCCVLGHERGQMGKIFFWNPIWWLDLALLEHNNYWVWVWVCCWWWFCSLLLEREACEKCPSLKSSSGNRFSSIGCWKTGIHIYHLSILSKILHTLFFQPFSQCLRLSLYTSQVTHQASA